jgi:hypothetical protein
VDPGWNRLDNFGCFVPSGMQMEYGDCSAIDFVAGMGNVGPVERDLNLCSDENIPTPPRGIVDDLFRIATLLSKRIGLFMRIDMIVNNNSVYIQEFSPNPMGGMRHCVARKHSSGCVDSCVLGKFWKASCGNSSIAVSQNEGPRTVLPSVLSDFRKLSAAEQCSLLEESSATFSQEKL